MCGVLQGHGQVSGLGLIYDPMLDFNRSNGVFMIDAQQLAYASLASATASVVPKFKLIAVIFSRDFVLVCHLLHPSCGLFLVQ